MCYCNIKGLLLWLAFVSVSACSVLPETLPLFNKQTGPAIKPEIVEEPLVPPVADVDPETQGLPELPIEPVLSPYEQINIPLEDEARAVFAKAQQHMKSRQWQQAAQDLLWLTANYPDLSGPYVNLAIVYEQQTLFEEAENYYKKAIEVNAVNLDAYNAYAILLRKQGRFNDAETYYLKALKIWPKDANSHKNIGILYELYMGRFNEALQHYKDYLSLQNSDAERGTPEAKQYRKTKGWIIDLERRIDQRQALIGGTP